METFTPDERRVLAPYFTDLDGPVFALVNLPEVVKGALFARYSRSPKSLRRLFLDEFADQIGEAPTASSIGTRRAEALYERVLGDYGDDSVAQLGGVHLACEGASNLLTKVLEWGRLMAYLEQSTRYVPYADRPDGRFRYHVPAELDGHPLRRALRRRRSTTPSRPMRASSISCASTGARAFRGRRVRATPPGARPSAPRPSTARAGSCPRPPGPMSASSAPARATRRSCCACARTPCARCATAPSSMLVELCKVIPAFLRRLVRPERGGAWSGYLARTREETAAASRRLLDGIEPAPRGEVTLTDFDPDGEVKVVAAALYAVSDLPDDQLLAIARKLGAAERGEVLAAYVGRRENRRHKPGRAFERTSYRFDVLGDYGAFRDLQRHRLLTLEWQRLSPRHGYAVPEELGEAGLGDDWVRVMDESAAHARRARPRGPAPTSRPMRWRWPIASASTWTSTPARRCT